jgi:outer membrane protein assembly factor BamB
MKLLNVTAVAVLVLSSLCAAQTPPTTQRKPRQWTQWRGQRRDGICDEKGLLQSWPQGGPRVLWTASDLGTGWSCPIIANGSIYITGDVGDELRIFALDPEGRPKCLSKHGRSWQGPYPGARACCIYDEGRLYHSNAHGRVACLDAETGREIWAVDTLERFEGEEITWGQAEHLLIDGDRVIVTPGGRKALPGGRAGAVNMDISAPDVIWAFFRQF